MNCKYFLFWMNGTFLNSWMCFLSQTGVGRWGETSSSLASVSRMSWPTCTLRALGVQRHFTLYRDMMAIFQGVQVFSVCCVDPILRGPSMHLPRSAFFLDCFCTSCVSVQYSLFWVLLKANPEARWPTLLSPEVSRLDNSAGQLLDSMYQHWWSLTLWVYGKVWWLSLLNRLDPTYPWDSSTQFHECYYNRSYF